MSKRKRLDLSKGSKEVEAFKPSRKKNEILLSPEQESSINHNERLTEILEGLITT